MWDQSCIENILKAIGFWLEFGIYQIHIKNLKIIHTCAQVCVRQETGKQRETEVEREKLLVKTWFPNSTNANLQIQVVSCSIFKNSQNFRDIEIVNNTQTYRKYIIQELCNIIKTIFILPFLQGNYFKS